MNTPPTVMDLYATYCERLRLAWAGGKAGRHREIVADNDPQLRVSLVGYMNLVRPKQIQVLGQTELDHLQGLTADARGLALDGLFSANTQVVLIGDGLAAPALLVERANTAKTPLLISTLTGPELIDLIRFQLIDMLSSRLTLHGVFIEVLGVGVLLTGAVGVGKSELALDLIQRGHRLIADDAPEFIRVAPELVRGTCPEPLGGFLEVRGLGILNVRQMYGDTTVKRAKYLGLIVHLEPNASEMGTLDRFADSLHSQTVVGVDIPKVILYVDPVRNLAVLAEAAVRQHLLRRSGYSAANDLAERQRALMNQEPT